MTLEISGFYSVFEYSQQSGMIIAGADEAGRGPLAGPVVAAAVVMRDVINGVDDSKKLSEKKRTFLYDEILKSVLTCGVGIVAQDIIDEVNILNATRRAFHEAVRKLNPSPDYLVNDEIKGLEVGVQNMSIVKGDSKVYDIAAASIIAKVARDKIMCEYDELYPEYGFAKHKGYGTKVHIEAIRKYGLCPIHRRSFCKNFVGENS